MYSYNYSGKEKTFSKYYQTWEFGAEPKGLMNIGSSCYMNVVLQCFYHIRALADNILNDNSITPNCHYLTYSFQKILEYLRDTKNVNNAHYKDSSTLSNFKIAIGNFNKQFAGLGPNDSKDLILELLEIMHQELNTNRGQSYPKDLWNQTNRDQVINSETQRVCYMNNSIIFDLFYGFNEIKFDCQNCKKSFYNCQTFNFIEFPVEKIFNETSNKQYNLVGSNIMSGYNIKTETTNNDYGSFFKRQNVQHNYISHTNHTYNTNKRVIKLMDCFQACAKPYYMSGENEMFCNQCNNSSSFKVTEKYFSLPNVLIIMFNYGKNIKFPCSIDFPEELNLSQFCQEQNANKYYKLSAVISHLGESGAGGHFVAYCRHTNNKFYRFNDDVVNVSSVEESKKGLTYILFYTKK